MSPYAIPTDEEFRAESERFLPICAAHCTCPNGWHFVWSAFKASGRRRSIYFQQPLLARLLTRVLPVTRKILIAGAADAGILSVLGSIFGADAEYVAIDVCAAPLEALRDYAAREGLSLRCQQVALQDFAPQETFDLVFMHNTLCFLPPQDAAEVLRTLRRAIRPGGWMACGMRYERHVRGLRGTDPAQFSAMTRAMIRATFADRPDLASLVDPHVDAYDATYRHGGFHHYEPEQFKILLDTVGYVTVDRYTDTVTPAAMLNFTPTNSDVLSEVLLLRTRVGVGMQR